MDLDRLMQQFGPIKERIAQAEEERRAARMEGSAGGGAINVVLSGDLRIESVRLAPACAAAVADDPSMLEDLIAVAVNDALARYRERFGSSPEEQLQKSMGDDLGSLFGPMMGGFGG